MSTFRLAMWRAIYVDWFQKNPWKLVKINGNQLLKISGIVLQPYSVWRNFYLRKLTKSLYKKGESLVPDPLSNPHPQPNPSTMTVWVRVDKLTGLLLPFALSQGIWYLPKRSRLPAFLKPPALNCTVNSWQLLLRY